MRVTLNLLDPQSIALAFDPRSHRIQRQPLPLFTPTKHYLTSVLYTF